MTIRSCHACAGSRNDATRSCCRVRSHIDLVISRCPGMVADMVKVAMATGARQDELLKARRDRVDHDRRQLTIIGKGNKQRVIDLEPLRRLCPDLGPARLCWQAAPVLALGGRELQELRWQLP